MKLTAEHVEAMAGVYLSPRYDSPQPTPDFHRECWARYCSDAPACATAAPRNHAKSTGLTHDYCLANVLFQSEPYVIIVGSSEELAIEHLGDIRSELQENDDLRKAFLIKDFIVDQKTDIIVECEGGYQFRIIARGAEQKIRGRKWRGRRPGLIIGDDLEDDEQVENKDRRRKFRRWFFRACKQALRDGGKIRVHGTILHEDSLLNHLIKNKSWDSRKYKAHQGFSDFTNILWPEKFPEERLRAIQKEFVDEGDSAGYSQEYLNDPHDNEDVYIRREDFIPMRDEDKGYNLHSAPKVFYCGMDFAISKADAANRTSITVGGKTLDNRLCIVDQRVGRWDIIKARNSEDETSIIDEMFSVQIRWNIDTWFVEDGQIWKSMKTMLYAEMQKRDIYLHIIVLVPIKDKAVRGRNYQKRSKAGQMAYDTEASWFDGYQGEILLFKADSEATADDQFDSTAWLCKGVENITLEREDYQTPEEEEFEMQLQIHQMSQNRSAVTGY